MEIVSGQLRKLTALSLVEIKLERDLVGGCSQDKARAMLCELMIDLIHQLKAKAVAVGVEKHADVELLSRIGCDMAQGYAFGEPKPLDDFLALLKRRAKGMAARKTRQTALTP